jgi:hypothetical protein
MTLHNLAPLVYAHREAIIGGFLALLGYSVDPSPRIVRLRRILLSLHRPDQSTPAKETTMSIFSPIEAKLHAAADAFSVHGSVETLKADLSAIYNLFHPILTIGAPGLAPVIAKVAEDAIAAKVGGDIGATLGADAAALITAEGAKI